VTQRCLVATAFSLQREIGRRWWNDEKLVKQAAVGAATPKRLYIATSSEGSIAAVRRLTKSLSRRLRVWSHPMPEEKHATIYHPAALRAFRLLFPPEQRPISWTP